MSYVITYVNITKENVIVSLSLF